ncbi:MAG: hypothetical protein U0X91_17120 [Spirosomataceae bacterium]
MAIGLFVASCNGFFKTVGVSCAVSEDTDNGYKIRPSATFVSVLTDKAITVGVFSAVSEDTDKGYKIRPSV